MQNPCSGHLQAAYHALRYLSKDLGVGIFYLQIFFFQIQAFCCGMFWFTPICKWFLHESLGFSNILEIKETTNHCSFFCWSRVPLYVSSCSRDHLDCLTSSWFDHHSILSSAYKLWQSGKNSHCQKSYFLRTNKAYWAWLPFRLWETSWWFDLFIICSIFSVSWLIHHGSCRASSSFLTEQIECPISRHQLERGVVIGENENSDKTQKK